MWIWYDVAYLLVHDPFNFIKDALHKLRPCTKVLIACRMAMIWLGAINWFMLSQGFQCLSCLTLHLVKLFIMSKGSSSHKVGRKISTLRYLSLLGTLAHGHLFKPLRDIHICGSCIIRDGMNLCKISFIHFLLYYFKLRLLYVKVRSILTQSFGDLNPTWFFNRLFLTVVVAVYILQNDIFNWGVECRKIGLIVFLLWQGGGLVCSFFLSN